MFHVELRRFPHLARLFNLSEEELRARIVLPWIRGTAVELDDRRWTPDRTRLTIYEGPEVAAEERGLGRGWSTVTRLGQDVSARLVEDARKLLPNVSELKRKLMAASQPVPLREAVTMVGPVGRPSERLAVAEQAVWELLHEDRLVLVRTGSPLQRTEWESVLLRWESWADPGAVVQLEVVRA